MRDKFQNLKGVTLLELTILLGILITLYLVGSPFFKNFTPTLRLNSETRKMATELRKAQQYSVTEQVDYQIRFFITENKYQLIKLTIPEEELIEEITIHPQINIQSIEGLTDNRVSFNCSGAPSDTGSINLINTNNKTSIVYIRPSGYIRTD